MLKLNEKTETFMERWGRILRNKVFHFSHELMETQMANVLVIKILLIIETFQVVYYSIHPNLKQIWTTSIFESVRNLSKYFGLESTLRGSTLESWSLILYITILFHCAVFVSILTIAIRTQTNSNSKSVGILFYPLRLINLYFMLFQSILLIPSYQILIIGFNCGPESDFTKKWSCDSMQYFINMVLCVFGLMVL
jgi:hypothetical protein